MRLLALDKSFATESRPISHGPGAFAEVVSWKPTRDLALLTS
jgi:hypothetical protein